MREKPTQLYRHYDSDGVLLYIGISISAAHRLSQHICGSKWAAEITSVSIENFSTRAEAENVERLAIIAEKPIWNIVYNQTEKPKKESAPQNTRKYKQLDINKIITPISFLGDEITRIRHVSAMVKKIECQSGGCFELTVSSDMMADKLGLDLLYENSRFSVGSSAINMCSGYSCKVTPSNTFYLLYLAAPDDIATFCEKPLGQRISEILPELSRYKTAYEQFAA